MALGRDVAAFGVGRPVGRNRRGRLKAAQNGVPGLFGAQRFRRGML